MKYPASFLHQLLLTVLLLALGNVCSLNAAAFIKFDGIDGESVDDKHGKSSDVLAWSWGVTQAVTLSETGGTRGRGDVKVEDIQITQYLDKSSPKLYEAVTQGKVFAKVDLFITGTYGGARKDYIVITMTNVVVTAVSTVDRGEPGDRPIEKVSLNFETITYTYTEFDDSGAPKGSVEMTWSVATQEP